MQKIKNKKYLCVGENFSSRINIGYCGDVHTMDEWLKIIFKDYEKAKEFFKQDTEKEILGYIHEYFGKRLKRVGG